MDTVAQAQFVHNYSRLLVDVWTKKLDFHQLETAPVSVLNEYNIPTEAGAQIQLDERASGGRSDVNAGVQQQIAAWDQGNQTGIYVLYVPKVPQVQIEPTGYMSADMSADITACCCCCPCCTTT